MDQALSPLHQESVRETELSPDGRLRVGLGAVGPVPLACGRIQQAFLDGRLLRNLDQVIAEEIARIDAIADLHTSAAYRRKLAAVCLADCIRELVA